MLQGILHEGDSLFVFLLVTVAMGGWAAWMAGRAMALTWRSSSHVAAACLGVACGVRFIHFALFQDTLLQPYYFAVDLIVILTFGFLGYRVTRVRQMTTQYRWLYEKTGPLSWRERTPGAGAATGGEPSGG